MVSGICTFNSKQHELEPWYWDAHSPQGCGESPRGPAGRFRSRGVDDAPWRIQSTKRAGRAEASAGRTACPCSLRGRASEFVAATGRAGSARSRGPT